MPIPHSDCADDIADDVCCDTIWLMCERIRTVAQSGVATCLDDECDSRTFRSWTRWGTQIEDPHGESLIVSPTRVSSAALATSARGRQLPIIVTRVEIQIELRETGWATPRGANDAGAIETVDWEVEAAQTKHAVGHAQKMWHTLVGAVAERNGTSLLFPSLNNPHIVQRGIQVGDLTPLPPGAYIAGSRMSVSVDYLPGMIPAAALGS